MTSLSITAQRLAKRAQALKNKMNADEKCSLAAEMGNALDHDSMSDMERTIALEILERLIADEIDAVREAVADSVASSPHLPKEMAEKLAQDILDVSIPVLKLSPILEDRFLSEIIDSGAMEKISAIAQRDNVSPNLSRKIVASGKTPSVVHLLNNRSSHISDQTIVTIIRVYGDHHRIEEALFSRNCLNLELIQTLKTLAEDHVSTFVTRYFNLPSNAINVESSDDKGGASWWDDKKGAV